jgi:hypothetical protein
MWAYQVWNRKETFMLDPAIRLKKLKTKLEILGRSNHLKKLCYDPRSVSQSTLVSSTHLGPRTRFLLMSDSFEFVHVGHPFCILQLPLVLAIVPRGSWPYFTVWLETPNLKGQVPVFISPRNRVAQLYSQALGSHLVASYDSQEYTPPHGEIIAYFPSAFTYFVENAGSNSSSAVACVLVALGTYLSNHCLATPIYSASTIPAFGSSREHTQTAKWSHKRPLHFFKWGK